jgi:hypothetical protein
MGKAPRSGSSSETATVGAQDLHPTSDIRFVIHEIGKLTSKVDRLIDDVDKHGDKIDAVRHQVTFVKGALWVIGFIITAICVVAAWYVTGKFSITLSPPGGH